MLMPSIFGENLFDDFFDDFYRPAVRRQSAPHRTAPFTANGLMKTDVKETETGFELDIELPGYKKEDVQAELKDGYMKITASSKQENEDKDQNGKFIRKERFVGTCSRSFYVGDAVTEEDIKARFENGVLKICIPKKEKTPEVEEQKYIAIE